MTAPGNRARTAWLVDLENTGGRWALASRLFRPGDLVAMFWSGKSCTPDLKAMSAVPGVDYEFLECESGTPNAMDFQLAAWLGRISVLEPGADFVILAKDHGYGPLRPFFRRLGVSVQLLDPEDAASVPEIEPENPVPADLAKIASPVKSAYIEKLRAAGVTDPDDLRITSAILMQSMRLPRNMRKLDARNRLTNRYGAAEGNLRYNAIRHVVHDIADNGPWPERNIPGAAPNDVNTALSKAGIVLKTGQVGKAVNALNIAAACGDAEAAKKSLRSSISRIFAPGCHQKAMSALSPFLPEQEPEPDDKTGGTKT